MDSEKQIDLTCEKYYILSFSYSLLRQGHKLLDKTYKEYRLQLMDTLKQFSEIR